MGIADLVPGISGGTIALITGIYDELIKSITQATYLPQKIMNGEFKAILKLNYKFLIPLFLGIVTALLLGARLMSYLLLTYPSQTYSLFIGLILASIYFLSKKYVKETKASIGMIFGFMLGIILSIIAFNLPTPGLGLTFGLGFIAITAMILPGISGSYILLMLGQYEYAINLVSGLPGTWIPALIFIIGCVFGLLVFSRLIYYLLKNYSAQTHGALVGLMFGALIVPIKLVIEVGFEIYSLLFLILGLLLIKFMK